MLELLINLLGGNLIFTIVLLLVVHPTIYRHITGIDITGVRLRRPRRKSRIKGKGR